jgi:hypothetical protein
MQYRLRTLLILLATLAASPGCRYGRIEQIQSGAESVDRHAKEIEQAAESQP